MLEMSSAYEALRERLGTRDICIDQKTDWEGEHKVVLRTELMVTKTADGAYSLWAHLRAPSHQPNRYSYVRIDDLVTKIREQAEPKAKRSVLRDGLSPRRRFEILKRDEFRCTYCGAGAQDAVLHVDHVLAVTEGGKNDDANLVTACEPCNMGKGNRPL